MDQALNSNAQNIKQVLSELVRLQRIDHQILERRNQAKQLESGIRQAESNLTGLRQVLDSRKQEMEELLKERREAERTVKERQEQISKLSSQIFDVKTNEAYNTLQGEIKQKKQEVGLLEERILEMMMSEDELKKAAAQDQAALQAAEKEVRSEQAKIQQDVAGLEKEVEALQAQWQEAAGSVRADHLDRYIRLRDAKDGHALAKIENDICTGCRLTIRPQAAIELQKYRALLLCENCARILYIED